VGHFDAEGFLHITDRLKDLINSGGEKIASREVERVLAEHPAVHEAAVIGVPDPLWGERVHAVVSLRPGATADAEELRRWCRTRLAGFKVPKTLAVVDDIPKTATGKVAKDVLRRQYRPTGPGPGENDTMG
jgi:fatty-acyl-CoA synthase